ncbi:MAG: hypothetical protein ACF8XB_25830 [Planctomycetota bacterium JB042]
MTPVRTFDFHGLDVPRCRLALLNLLDRHAGQDVTLACVHGRGAGLLAAEIARIAAGDPRIRRAERDPSNDGVTLLTLAPNRPRRNAPPRRPPAYDPDEPPERRRKRR